MHLRGQSVETGPGSDVWKSQVSYFFLRNIHSLDVVLANLKTNCSEAWALPICVVFAVAVYAALAVIFYNADD